MTNDQSNHAAGLYTTGEVEQRTGVPATTLRQWERRYGLPKPTRDENGYRLYSAADLARIEFLQARLAEGIAISRAVQLCRERLAERAATREDFEPLKQLSVELRSATLTGDHGRASELLSEAHARWSVEDVLVKIVQPALYEIGTLWERGEISVAHEHRATAFLRGKISQLLELVGVGVFGPTVVAACAPEEAHEIGLLMLGVVARRAGMRVHYLGAGLPVADLALLTREAQADGLLISCSTMGAVNSLRAGLPALHDLGTPLFFGGAAFNAEPQLAQELGGHYLGADAARAVRSLVAFYEGWRGEAPSSPQGEHDGEGPARITRGPGEAG